MKLCSHEGCEKKAHARSMCTYHYNKWLRTTSVKTNKRGMRDDVLDAMPATRTEIMRKLECNRSTVDRWIAKLHGNGVYISGWKHPEVRGPFVAVYSKGSAPDVPCRLKRITKNESWKRYKSKHAERLALKAKAMWAIQKARRSSATWASALGIAA